MTHWLVLGARTRRGVIAASVLQFALVAEMPVSMAGGAELAGKNSCSADAKNAGITLPKGFCATIFADKVGAPRHMAVGPDGTVYVNNRSRKSSSSGSLLALKDTKGQGHADLVERFGPPDDGGTGIAIYNNGVYVDLGDEIVRYDLKPGDIAPKGKPETIVSGIPQNGDHKSRQFAIDPAGNLFLNIGSATDSCQVDNRAPESPGIDPCIELETHSGVWRFDANKTGQLFSPAARYTTGIRNAAGIDFDESGRVYATQHGRDQLHENWQHLYTSKQGSEQPAEILVELREGGDYGWPYCYFDAAQNKHVLAPEYGGDGGKAVGRCADKLPPVAAYPAHWAPNDLKIYKANAFPEAYRGGAFIAFHGSWNRSDGPQQGYKVVFQPLADGKASGPYTTFADRFRDGDPEGVEHRPTGLAVGPDGALYVSDDAGGRIWRIVYTGN